MRTDINACGCTRGCTAIVREYALKVDFQRNIPCRTREVNLPQWCATLTICQLSYIPTPNYNHTKYSTLSSTIPHSVSESHSRTNPHSYMPTPKLRFQKNHQNLEQSIIFRNTSATVSPYLWNKSSYQILWENWRAIHCAPPLTIPCSWEGCLPITLNCPPVQSFHNSSVNFRIHASVTFLLNGDERPLLMVRFLKHLETSPFHWRWFCGCVINRLGHAFPRTWNIFTNGTLILKIYSAYNFADVMFSSGNFVETFLRSCLSCMRRALPRANLHISIFCTCATHPKATSVSAGTKASATLGENQKGRVCSSLLFHDWQNLELLRGNP